MGIIKKFIDLFPLFISIDSIDIEFICSESISIESIDIEFSLFIMPSIEGCDAIKYK